MRIIAHHLPAPDEVRADNVRLHTLTGVDASGYFAAVAPDPSDPANVVIYFAEPDVPSGVTQQFRVARIPIVTAAPGAVLPGSGFPG